MAPLRTAWVSGPSTPDCLSTLEQEPSHQVRRRQVLMTCGGDEVAAQLIGHRLHEAGFPAAGRPLQQYRRSAACRGAKHFHLVTDWPVNGASERVRAVWSNTQSPRSNGTVFG